MGKIIFSNRAKDDLFDIWNYTNTEWSESKADDYIKHLWETINYYGGSYYLTKMMRHPFEKLRFVNIKSHIVLFEELDNSKIGVVRIIHKKRDVFNILSQ